MAFLIPRARRLEGREEKVPMEAASRLKEEGSLPTLDVADKSRRHHSAGKKIPEIFRLNNLVFEALTVKACF